VAGILQVPEIVKLREVSAAMGGPPSGPMGLRVSTKRHGVAGTKCNALAGETGFASKFAVTDVLAVRVRHPAAFTATPLQPVKIWSAAGFAVRQTVEPGG
jgi:hypothetical protein